MNDYRCEEVEGMIGSQYIRCGAPATKLIQHRGRTEGPYWMCDFHADHNIHNRGGENVTPAKQHASDNCQFCLGAKGGVRGNENVFAGVVVCDYCTPLVVKIIQAVREGRLK